MGDQYYDVHPNSRVVIEVPFQAFACEATSVTSVEEFDAYAAQTIAHGKPPNPGRSWKRRGGGQPNYFPPDGSSSEQRPILSQQPIPIHRQFMDSSNPKGDCVRCNFWTHDILMFPYTMSYYNGGSGSRQPKGNMRNSGCWGCRRLH